MSLTTNFKLASATTSGAAYAALPEKYYLAGGEVPTWDAKQMHAFADRTHALRVESLAAAHCEELDKLSQRNYELRLASHGQAPAGVTLRSMIEGMSVSVDVSTGDHDAGHRYFGTVTEVMECQGDKHGVTLLVQDAEPNFTATPTAPSTPSSTAQQAPAGAAQADSVQEDAARHFFDAGWKACANFCDRDDVRFDGIVGHRGCPPFEEAFREVLKKGVCSP